MTISLKANAAGNAGQILIGATPVVSLPVASGIPFMKNILINGNLAINQRGVTIAAAANGSYGPDRWKKVDASNMTQIVEAGNFRPATVYTLSGIGVTTQQITSPASGNWTLPNIPITATNIQLEEGEVATPFEMRNIGFELSLCQRYYFRIKSVTTNVFANGYCENATSGIGLVVFKQSMRIPPTALETTGVASDYSVLWGGGGVAVASNLPTIGSATIDSCSMRIATTGLTPQGGGMLRFNSASAFVGFSAEL